MTKPANSHDKPSPSDTPSHRPHDQGHKSIIHSSDKEYDADQPQNEDIAKKHERDEQPVEAVKNPPAEKGMDKGQVQPG